MGEPSPLAAQIAALEDMAIVPLREAWRRAGLGSPPPMRSADLLRRILAWKLQAQVYGGLSSETRRALKLSPKAVQHQPIPPGLRLAREWRGKRYDVEVVEDGVRYQDRTYASLSEVAREITGVRWNGPRFFGLRGRG